MGRYAPKIVREAVRNNARVIADNYSMLRQVVLDFVLAGLEFTGEGLLRTPAAASGGDTRPPMDIGALMKGKRGKGKDKGDKGFNNGGGQGQRQGQGQRSEEQRRQECCRSRQRCSVLWQLLLLR